MNLATAAQSSIGRKLINGFTGLLLLGFVIGHLIGNLLLLVGPAPFNEYAYFLTHVGHGFALPVVELGLFLVFAFHIWSGYSVWANKAKARKHSYAVPADAGGKSQKSVSSTSMLYTGLLLVAFVVVHIMQFKLALFNGGRHPEVTVNGVEMDNLYIFVVTAFGSVFWTGAYIVVMAALGTHLWHGAWSLFQSLGLANDKYLPTIRKIAHVAALVLAVGFLMLPAVICGANGHFVEMNNQYEMQLKTQEHGSNINSINGVQYTVEKEA